MITQALPNVLYTAADAAKIDREAIRSVPVAGFTLMQRAAKGAWDLVQRKWPLVRKVVIVAGAGNNAGDGYALAALMQEADWDVHVLALVDPNELRHEASDAVALCRQRGVSIAMYDPNSSHLPHAELYVDALFGVGLTRDVTGIFQAVIQQLNANSAPVLALDIPSGLCANTGVPKGIAVCATDTVTFIAVKRGLLTANGPDCAGELWFDDLGVPTDLVERCCTGVKRLAKDTVKTLPARLANSHKGRFGHVLVIGGDTGMGGALVLATEAAVCAGAGRVTAVTHPENITAIMMRCPEALSVSAVHGHHIGSILSQVDVIVIGPGLGTRDWGASLLKQVLNALPDHPEWRVVLDADALNLIADGAVHWETRVADRIIVTPHPGEASRLLSRLALQSDAAVQTKTWSIADVQSDRFAAMKTLLDQYGAHVILKGVGTLVGSLKEPSCQTNTPNYAIGVCSFGNPGMASAGMGDVLSGIIGGLMAQGMAQADAAVLGVVSHALSADTLWNRGAVISVRPSDMMPVIQRVLSEFVV